MNTRTIRYCGAALLLVLYASAEARANQEMLASAKSLYESASYEAALSELSAIDNAELVDVVDTYRALCLLGLGRARDAEQVLEVIVTRRPLLVISDTEYSPRVVALYRDVRRKALPAAAQRLYSAARTNFENKNYDAAAEGFRQALQVIADVGQESQTATLADLKELASGFLALAEVRVASIATPRAPAATPQQVAPQPVAMKPQPAAPPPVAMKPQPVAPPPVAMKPEPIAPQPVATKMSPVLYGMLDTEVTPPVVIQQAVPPWTFAPQLKTGVFTGTLELVVDERGAVESVKLVEPVWAPYDAALLEAAKGWRYEPALKEGKPVKFKRFLAIRVDPRGPRSR